MFCFPISDHVMTDTQENCFFQKLHFLCAYASITNEKPIGKIAIIQLQVGVANGKIQDSPRCRDPS